MSSSLFTTSGCWVSPGGRIFFGIQSSLDGIFILGKFITFNLAAHPAFPLADRSAFTKSKTFRAVSGQPLCPHVGSQIPKSGPNHSQQVFMNWDYIQHVATSKADILSWNKQGRSLKTKIKKKKITPQYLSQSCLNYQTKVGTLMLLYLPAFILV